MAYCSLYWISISHSDYLPISPIHYLGVSIDYIIVNRPCVLISQHYLLFLLIMSLCRYLLHTFHTLVILHTLYFVYFLFRTFILILLLWKPKSYFTIINLILRRFFFPFFSIPNFGDVYYVDSLRPNDNHLCRYVNKIQYLFCKYPLMNSLYHFCPSFTYLILPTYFSRYDLNSEPCKNADVPMYQ